MFGLAELRAGPSFSSSKGSRSMTRPLVIATLLTVSMLVPASHAMPGAFYCQPPSFDYAVNASSAFDSEVCDDLPDSLAGHSITEITLYVTEWGHSEWVDPMGVVIRLYDGSCPPPLHAAAEYNISWDGLVSGLEYAEPPMRIVHRVMVVLPEPVTVTAGMSLGAFVVTGWADEPYAGLALTEPDEVYACGELYWDDEVHGAPRWTELSSATNIAADLAFCLSDEVTGIEAQRETSWGRIKSLYR